MKSIIKKRTFLIIFLLVVLVVVSVMLTFSNHVSKPSQPGFTIVFQKDNNPLLSDSDILSYNWTSQEILLTDEAFQRLTQQGMNLYSFTDGFVIKINGEEIYQGIFRSPIMSAIPAPPKISIMFPNVLFPSSTPDNHAIRMFYPSFQPPIDQQEKNSQLSQYFEQASKLTY